MKDTINKGVLIIELEFNNDGFFHLDKDILKDYKSKYDKQAYPDYYEYTEVNDYSIKCKRVYPIDSLEKAIAFLTAVRDGFYGKHKSHIDKTKTTVDSVINALQGVIAFGGHKKAFAVYDDFSESYSYKSSFCYYLDPDYESSLTGYFTENCPVPMKQTTDSE